MRAESVVSSAPDMSAKELSSSAKQPYISAKGHFSRYKGEGRYIPNQPYLQKSPLFLQKSPIFLQRSISPQYKGKEHCMQKAPYFSVDSTRREKETGDEREGERERDRQAASTPRRGAALYSGPQYSIRQ